VIEIPANGSSDLVREEKLIAAKSLMDLETLQARLEVAKAGTDEDYAEAVAKLSEGEKILFQRMAKVRCELAVAKVPHIVEHLTNALANGPVVYFGHHIEAIEMVQTQMEAAGFRVTSITGATPMSERQGRVDAFQAGEFDLIIGNAAMEVGLTLTRSRHVVFGEIDWVPANMAQREDRCVLEGQPVLTTRGWVPIEDVEIGEKVLTEDGSFQRVLDKWSKGNRKLTAELRVQGWQQPIKLTADHRLLTVEGWKEAGELKPGDRLQLPTGVEFDSRQAVDLPSEAKCKTTVENAFGREGHEISNARLITISGLDLNIECLYAMGYFLGDGFAATDRDKGAFVSWSYDVESKRKQRAQVRCRAWANSVGVHCSESERGRSGELRAYSRELANAFRLWFGHTARGKKMPEWMYKLSSVQLSALLEGLLDSDGYRRKGRNEYVTVSDELASGVCWLMMRLGYAARISRQATGAYVVAYSDQAERSTKIRSVVLRHHKKSEVVYDLTVENNASFVVGNIVAHNCHRIGQENSVLVQHLVFEGSLDCHISRTLVQKMAVIKATLDAPSA
jgi:hypothetical protein